MAIPEGGKGPWGAPTLLDIPLDENSSYKRGAAAAPPLIRDALTSESSNMSTELGVDVGAEGAYADGGEVNLTSGDSFTAIEKAVSALLERTANGMEMIFLLRTYSRIFFGKVPYFRG